MNAKTFVSTMVAGITLSVMCGCFPSNSEPDTTLGKLLDTELLLPREESPELRREVEYWPLTRSKKNITVFYRAGGMLEESYRADGTLASRTEWYPLEGGWPPLSVKSQNLEDLVDADQSGGNKRVSEVPNQFGPIRRSFQLLADGRVDKAAIFRKDGTKLAEGSRLVDGSFEQFDYALDGKTVAQQRRFSKEGELVYARVMLGDKIKSLTKKVSDSHEETIEFRDDGSRRSKTIRELATRYEEIEFFKADGQTLRLVVYRKLKIEALYFKEDGSVDHFRSFDGDGGMTVVKYRDNAGSVRPVADNGRTPKEAYRQTWRGDGHEHYTLDRLEEIGATGYVSRRFAFSLTGGKLFKIDYLDKEYSSTKVLILRDDMTVERIDNYERFGDSRIPSIQSVAVEPEKKMRDSFDEKMFEQLPYEDVRNLVGPPIPPPTQPDIDHDEEWLD